MKKSEHYGRVFVPHGSGCPRLACREGIGQLGVCRVSFFETTNEKKSRAMSGEHVAMADQ
jgi:hypothetical protein